MKGGKREMQEKIEEIIRETLFLWDEPDDPREWKLDGFAETAAKIAKLFERKVIWEGEGEPMMIEIDFSLYADLPREQVVEWAVLRSGRIVAMTDDESYWFESDGRSPKGSYLTPWPPKCSDAVPGCLIVEEIDESRT